jgi:hypothetical protein
MGCQCRERIAALSNIIHQFAGLVLLEFRQRRGSGRYHTGRGSRGVRLNLWLSWEKIEKPGVAGLVIRQRVRIDGRVELPVVVIQLQGDIDSTYIPLACLRNIQHSYPIDTIPKFYIYLVTALGSSIKSVLEPIAQERPGKSVIPGIDGIEI